jgi:hypothetical protein
VGLVALGFIVIVFGVALVQRFFHPPIRSTIERSSGNQQPIVIQCEIVNASGKNGLARSVMNYLRERGFDVVDASTAPVADQRSHVLDRVGNRQAALNIARALGIADTLVRSQIDSMLFLHATVVLGTDALQLECITHSPNQ